MPDGVGRSTGEQAEQGPPPTPLCLPIGRSVRARLAGVIEALRA